MFINGDEWTEKVRDRIIYAIDLVAWDALYHVQCNVNFRNKKNMPKKFRPEGYIESSVGRKKNMENLNAFQKVLNDFYENDVPVKVKVLVDRMAKLVPNPYSERNMRRELTKIEGIIIASNIVSTKSNVATVMKTFHLKNTSDMCESEWKTHIIETAAKLVKAEIDDKKEQRDMYPDISNIGDIEKHLDYVPPLLRYFLGVVI